MKIIQIRNVFRVLAGHEKPDDELHVLLSDKVIHKSLQFNQNIPSIGGTTAGHEIGVMEAVAPPDQGKAGMAMGYHRIQACVLSKSVVKDLKEIPLQYGGIVVKKKNNLSTGPGQTEVPRIPHFPEVHVKGEIDYGKIVFKMFR
jgi:hypothetical protein